jgi:phosphoadenosine phosphosulfate reductase
MYLLVSFLGHSGRKDIFMPTEICPSPIGAVDVEDLKQEFEPLSPAERIRRSAELFAGELIAVTSFKPTAPVMLKLIAEEAPDTPVHNIRHHHESLKTLELSTWYARKFCLNVHTRDTPVLPIPVEGSAAFAEFQHQLKVEPFQEILDEWQPRAFLSGVMRWQSPERADLPIVQDKGAAIAINPVVDLSREAVEHFFAETGLPRDDNYVDPTKGRDQKLECGLNTTIYERREGNHV